MLGASIGNGSDYYNRFDAIGRHKTIQPGTGQHAVHHRFGGKPGIGIVPSPAEINHLVGGRTGYLGSTRNRR